MSALLNTECRLSAVINYQLTEQLYERLQVDMMNLTKSISISDFAGEIHQFISQALHLPVHVSEYQQKSQIFYVIKAVYLIILSKK